MHQSRNERAPADAQTGLTAFTGTFNGSVSQTFGFIGTNGHLWEAVDDASSNTWRNVDASATYSQPALATGSALTSFTGIFNGSAYQVFAFISANGHLREMSHNVSDGAWGNVDAFIGGNGHLWGVIYNVSSNNWGNLDVTSAAARPAP